MNLRIVAGLALLLSSAILQARTFHVRPAGSDTNSGTSRTPFRTIQHAADLAQPGDEIVVHAGVYRERVSPPRGGASETKPIVYRAAPGEKVVITGSEKASGWERVQGDVWKTTLSNQFFGSFNPYRDVIHGDWFNPMKRVHHTGAVYLDGKALAEAPTLDDVMKPATDEPLWFGQVDDRNTIIWAQFKDADPNRREVEINVRQTVFYPEKAGINYITVRGFILEDAATPWAPPTAEQIGVIGPHWSKGWIIENNIVRNSICSGISLGKYGDEFDNTSANTAEGYVKTIQRALANGWTKQNVGHHIVRDNEIYNCGQTGIVGSLGAAFSIVTGNSIHDIHVRRDFSGAEIAGIKFHGAIDVQISRNRIYNAPLGLWLDWMAQGTRVSRNLFYSNDQDIFVEVDHGPFVVDNNLLLSAVSLNDNSQGGAYAHNLFAGKVSVRSYDSRQTPFLESHLTAVAGYHDNPRGDDRYYNNLFVGQADLTGYDTAPMPMSMDGNVYLAGAKPSKLDQDVIVNANDPKLELASRSTGVFLQLELGNSLTAAMPRKLVTGSLLGNASIPNLPYEQPDGSPIRIDTDYFGHRRADSNPTPGPFESPGEGDLNLQVW